MELRAQISNVRGGNSALVFSIRREVNVTINSAGRKMIWQAINS